MTSGPARGPAAGPEPRARRRTAAVLLGLAAVVAIVIAVFDPNRWGFYPGCPLHDMTGLECAGCGTLRALHALTRARWAEAFRLNPLIAVLAPVAVILLFNEARVLAGRRAWSPPVPAGRAAAALLVALVVYVLARNLF